MAKYDPCDNCNVRSEENCLKCFLHELVLENVNTKIERDELKKKLSARKKQLRGAVETAAKLRSQLIAISKKKEY